MNLRFKFRNTHSCSRATRDKNPKCAESHMCEPAGRKLSVQQFFVDFHRCKYKQTRYYTPNLKDTRLLACSSHMHMKQPCVSTRASNPFHQQDTTLQLMATWPSCRARNPYSARSSARARDFASGKLCPAFGSSTTPTPC